MANEFYEKLRSDGCVQGSLVELWLRRDAFLNVQTTTVPHYTLTKVGEPESTRKSFVGYVVGLTKEGISLVLGWDYDQDRNAGMGHIGGVRFNLDTIEKHLILRKPE